MLWIGLQCLIVVFPDHTHFLQQSCYGIESWLVCIEFKLILLLVCFVCILMSLTHGALGWFVLSDCGISLSYSLACCGQTSGPAH